MADFADKYARQLADEIVRRYEREALSMFLVPPPGNPVPDFPFAPSIEVYKPEPRDHALTMSWHYHAVVTPPSPSMLLTCVDSDDGAPLRSPLRGAPSERYRVQEKLARATVNCRRALRARNHRRARYWCHVAEQWSQTHKRRFE